MIFYFLVYSIIFFFIPATIQPYYSTSYANRPNIFSELPDEDTDRFVKALTNICQNNYKKSSIVESQKITHDEFSDKLIQGLRKTVKDLSK